MAKPTALSLLKSLPAIYCQAPSERGCLTLCADRPDCYCEPCKWVRSAQSLCTAPKAKASKPSVSPVAALRAAVEAYAASGKRTPAGAAKIRALLTAACGCWVCQSGTPGPTLTFAEHEATMAASAAHNAVRVYRAGERVVPGAAHQSIHTLTGIGMPDAVSTERADWLLPFGAVEAAREAQTFEAAWGKAWREAKAEHAAEVVKGSLASGASKHSGAVKVDASPAPTTLPDWIVSQVQLIGGARFRVTGRYLSGRGMEDFQWEVANLNDPRFNLRCAAMTPDCAAAVRARGRMFARAIPFDAPLGDEAGGIGAAVLASLPD